jgi:cell division cycle 20-like protein 1 (cofactor of APC complex)
MLAVGDDFGNINLMDLVKMKNIKTFSGHLARVGSLNWNKNLLASGSKDGNVNIWDVRLGNTNKYKAHSQ